MAKENGLGVKLHRVAGYWKKPPEGRYLPFKEMAAYGAGGMGVNFIMNIIYILISVTFIPQMYSIKVMHGTNIGLVVAVTQLLVQPVLGKILDSIHRSKHGKFQTFLMWFTPVMTVVLILATWTPQFSGAGAEKAELYRTIFAYLTCVPTLALSQMWFAVYNMVPSTMTPNTQERTDMLSPVSLVTSFAPTLLNVLVGPIRQFFANRDMEYMAFRILGLLFGLIGLALTYLIVFKTKERVYYVKQEEEKIPFFDGIRQVFKNKPFMIFQLANVFGVLRVFFSSQLLFIATYKFADTYGPGMTTWSALSLIVGFGATPAMALVPFITRKISKKWTFIFAQGLMTIPIAIAMLIGFENLPTGGITIPFIVLIGFLVSFQSGVGIVVSPALTADQYDYQQYKTGNRLEGFMNTVTAWTAGLAGAVFQYIPTLIQTRLGFQPGSEAFQPAKDVVYSTTVMDISNKWFNIAAMITVICSVLWMVILAVGYKFNEKEHAKIMQVIKDRAVDSTFDSDVGASTRNEEEAQALSQEIDREMGNKKSE